MMIPLARLNPLLRTPERRLALLAWTVAVAVQSGTLCGDTMRRLHVTHSLWTKGEPTVSITDMGILRESEPLGDSRIESATLPTDGGMTTVEGVKFSPGKKQPLFALVGRGGKLYAWNGLGQSLVMMPADIVATAAVKLLRLDGERAARFRFAVVAYLTFPMIAAVTLVYVFWLLKELGFSGNHAVLGCVGLLVGSTFLKYMQEQEESSLTFLLAAMGATHLLRWLRTESTESLLAGTSSLGFNLLVRITTVFDAFFLSLFVLASLARRSRKDGALGAARLSALRFLCASAVFYGVALALDRLYQFIRFRILDQQLQLDLWPAVGAAAWGWIRHGRGMFLSRGASSGRSSHRQNRYSCTTP